MLQSCSNEQGWTDTKTAMYIKETEHRSQKYLHVFAVSCSLLKIPKMYGVERLASSAMLRKLNVHTQENLNCIFILYHMQKSIQDLNTHDLKL